MTKENILLIDGSAFAFLHANKANYEETIASHFNTLFEKYNTKKYILFLEKSKTNFRLQVAYTQKYKGNRESKRETQIEYSPYLYEVLKCLREKFYGCTCIGVENDDAISICSNKMNSSSEYNPIICGDDIDLLSIKGTHYRLRKNIEIIVDEPTIEFVGEGKKRDLVATSLYNTYVKILKGSTKEHYKGLSRFGQVAAYNHLVNLKTEEEMQKLCFNLFVAEFGYSEGMNRLNEGFRLCYLLEDNVNFVMPVIRTYNKETPTKTNHFKLDGVL